MSNFDRLARPCRRLLPLVGCLVAWGTGTSAAPGPNLMPLPAAAEMKTGRLAVTPAFSVAFHGSVDARLRDGLTRLLQRTQERTGLTFAHTPAGEFAVAPETGAATLIIECAGPSAAVPVLGEDESYQLEISATQAVLRAATDRGILHGYATLQQLLQADATGWSLPVGRIADQPRFPWRGLMIDVARHWQPAEVIKRNLDGMALVKLNVLHLHLTEDQGFRIESKTSPRLHELGSDGHYFTQDQMRDLIAYATARGIRVVPEFDIPGHATSWVVGFPNLASAPGPYAIERKWGVFDPVLDPTNPKVYEVLDGFLGEMAALFPDPYIHIGGDENNGVQWSANPKIQTFIREHMLKDNPGLHAYFNTRVHSILAKHGKKLVGWDEILHPDLPGDSVIHSWRGPQGIAEATKRGFATILSNGYYIDLGYPGWEHYLNDPVPADSPLTPEQQKLVLGGEATMWAEWVTPETIDSRIWPRTAAIAERLWSAREVRDVPDMYRRLAVVSQRLEEAGLEHESYLDPALRRLAGDGATPDDLAALRRFVDLLEPVKHYQRGRHQPGATQFTPLTGLADCARPDSAAARELAVSVNEILYSRNASDETNAEVWWQLANWNITVDALTKGLAVHSPRLNEAKPLIEAMGNAAEVGQRTLRILESGRIPAPDWLPAQLAKLDQAAMPHAAVEFPAITALKQLAAAAALQDKHAGLSDEAWKQLLKDTVPPVAKP